MIASWAMAAPEEKRQEQNARNKKAARTAGRQRDIYMLAGHVCFSTWSLPVSAEALWDGIVPSHGLRELVAAATQHPPQARRQHGTRRAEELARHLSLDRSRAVVYKHGSVAPRAVQARCHAAA